MRSCFQADRHGAGDNIHLKGIPTCWPLDQKDKGNLAPGSLSEWRENLSEQSSTTWSMSSPHQNSFKVWGLLEPRRDKGTASMSHEHPQKHNVDICGSLCPGRRWGTPKVHVMVSDHSLLYGAQRGRSTGSRGYRIMKHLASPKAQLDCQAHSLPGCGHQPAGTSRPCVRPTGLGPIVPALCCAFEATGTLKSVSWQEEKSSKEPWVSLDWAVSSTLKLWFIPLCQASLYCVKTITLLYLLKTLKPPPQSFSANKG